MFTMGLTHPGVGTLLGIMLEIKDDKQQSKTKGQDVDRADSQSVASLA